MIEVVFFKRKESSVLRDDKAYVKHIYAFDGNIEDKPYSERFADDLYASFFFNGDIKHINNDKGTTLLIQNMFNIYNNQIVKHRNDMAYLRGSSIINHSGRYRESQEINPMYIMALETSDLAEPPSKTGTGLIKMCNNSVVKLPNSIYVSPTSKYYKKARLDRQSRKLQLSSISYDERYAKAVFLDETGNLRVVTGSVNWVGECVTFKVNGRNVTVDLGSKTFDLKFNSI